MMSLYMTKLISILIYVIYTLISSDLSHPREKKVKKKKRNTVSNRMIVWEHQILAIFGSVKKVMVSKTIERLISGAMADAVRQKVL